MDRILPHLQELEPEASFSGSLPRIVSSSGRVYFVKLGSPAERSQYEGEKASLQAINEAADGLSPRVLSFGLLGSDSSPYFISEYKDLAPLTKPAALRLAERMATELHRKVSPDGFGFGIPTYCGVTRLQNGWFATWHECYASMIQDLLTQLQEQGGQSVLLQKGKIIVDKVIPILLGSLDINPVILHGDLWSGNVGVDDRNQPIIFDPASYYGHNEAEYGHCYVCRINLNVDGGSLSIAKIFGGFPDSFFDAYHEHFPKAKPEAQYNLRMELYELFHYLNHTLIFGGRYARSAERKMDILIASLADL